jgi:hypothetical protein
MSGAIRLLPLCAFMAWRTFTFTLLCVSLFSVSRLIKQYFIQFYVTHLRAYDQYSKIEPTYAESFSKKLRIKIDVFSISISAGKENYVALDSLLYAIGLKSYQSEDCRQLQELPSAPPPPPPSLHLTL